MQEKTTSIFLPLNTSQEEADFNAMNFSEAFQQARKKIGAGGYFEWRGNIYNTFYKEEWVQLSDKDKQQFWQAVQTHRSASAKETEFSFSSNWKEGINQDYSDLGTYLEHAHTVAVDTCRDGHFDTFYINLDHDNKPEIILKDTSFDQIPDLVVIDTDNDNQFDILGEVDGKMQLLNAQIIDADEDYYQIEQIFQPDFSKQFEVVMPITGGENEAFTDDIFEEEIMNMDNELEWMDW